MANIFQIQEDLKSIFEAIEENEGELTPELEKELTFTQESFKNKIESYANAVKKLDYEIACIKDEKSRLDDLKKSKEKTIDRLKHIMAVAINTYGEKNKSGNHFVDYGTGKVSVRTSESVEVDDDVTNNFANRFMSCLNWYKIQNQLSRSIIDFADVIDYSNDNSESNETSSKITIEDLEDINFEFTTTVNVKDIIKNEKGFNIVKALVEQGVYSVKPKIDKISIKNKAKTDIEIPSYVYIVGKDNVNIK